MEVLSIYEYRLRMEAYNLSRVDKELEMHKQAWLNHLVTATKESGKNIVPVFKEFKDFFDYKKELKKVENPTKTIDPRMKRLAQIAKRVNEGR